LTGPISHKGLAQEVEDGALLLAAGFNDGQDAFDKATTVVGLSAMRGAPPDNRVTQGALGAVVGGLKIRD
jgi:hypothetical protein